MSLKFDATTQTIAWLRDRYQDGSLEIKPPYQRKPVWSAKQKCYLIESILLGLPVPEVYIHKTTTPDLKDLFGVVDGQQRIRTVLQFIGADNDPGEEEFVNFILDKIPTTSPWYNVKFSDLDVDIRRQFVGYSFAVRYLDTDREEDVRDMFRRLNKFLTPLNSQELRRATYSGPFVTVVNDLADDSYWAEHRLASPGQIRRSLDVQFVSELLIGVMHGPQGGATTIIDEYYFNYEDYEDEFPDQARSVSLFKSTLELIKTTLPEIRDTRWSNKSDFYTLFVSLSKIISTSDLPDDSKSRLHDNIINFGQLIDAYVKDRDTNALTDVINYVASVEKGANDKSRRVNRQTAFLNIISPIFVQRHS